MNSFVKLGITGLGIMATIHLILYFTISVMPSFMFTFYMPWMAFLIIGLGKLIARNVR